MTGAGHSILTTELQPHSAAFSAGQQLPPSPSRYSPRPTPSWSHTEPLLNNVHGHSHAVTLSLESSRHSCHLSSPNNSARVHPDSLTDMTLTSSGTATHSHASAILFQAHTVTLVTQSHKTPPTLSQAPQAHSHRHQLHPHTLTVSCILSCPCRSGTHSIPAGL